MQTDNISIIIPSYIGHINEYKRFLISNNKFNNDLIYTYIYVIVSENEIELFSNISSEYNNIYILSFKNLFQKYFNLLIDEDTFLNKYGAATFQSLKKLFGMLESKNELLFVIESETYFIRNCNLVTEIKNNIDTILYSYKFGNAIQEEVHLFAKNLFHIDYNIPFIGHTFCYQWIFLKKYIIDFYDNYNSKLLFNILNNTTAEHWVFIETIIYSYIYINNSKYNFKFIDMTETLSYIPCCEHFWRYYSNSITDINTLNLILKKYPFFCYTIQNTWNNNMNVNVINNYHNIKILTATPTLFEVNN